MTLTSAKNEQSSYQELYFNNKDKKPTTVHMYNYEGKFYIYIDLYVNDGDYAIVRDFYKKEYCAFTADGYCIVNLINGPMLTGKISIDNDDTLVFDGELNNQKIHIDSKHNPNKDCDAYFKIEAEITSWFLTNLISLSEG